MQSAEEEERKADDGDSQTASVKAETRPAFPRGAQGKKGACDPARCGTDLTRGSVQDLCGPSISRLTMPLRQRSLLQGE